ncbi:molybdopterin-dependent oxidoreductase [Paenibacillus tyrfis]|uniref:molybdopterin-dependent oxidoreductase n=1 Tax=Paenibacillus tyrfis TaxID=1501230 RepID=UPI000B596E5A|nr:molybdopterin-dependent oxidoreductase [Paenibacillus tyrfis]
MKPKRVWPYWLSGVPYGKRLVKLHRWNAWLLALLVVTGLLLFLEPVRAWGAGRVWLKEGHLWIGAASIAVVALYLPLLPRHWKQLRTKSAQRWNLGLVLFLLAGWSVTGVLLWLVRSLPSGWGNAALLFHDLFTWFGVPYAIYHSVSRSRWVKAAQNRPENRVGEEAREAGDISPSEPGRIVQMLRNAPISRATFLRTAAGLLLAFGLGPSFYRWLITASDTGGAELERLVREDANRMLPPPVPSAESNPPLGGGGQGQFRIYTVTPIPAFSSEDWKFALTGLVDREYAWSWEQFLKLKRTVQVSDFHCVTGWSVYQVTWEGIPLKELLELAKVRNEAKFVKFYSGDRVYTDCLSLEQARMDDVMVAVLMDGKPIPQQLGGPVRLVVPQMYAYKSVKWLQGIELIDKEHIGYWELRGYDNDAWVPKGREQA